MLSTLPMGSGYRWRAYTATMMDNPGSVLQIRGRDFTIYEKMLRDDQCKATLQQRRAAVTSREWQVEPVSEAAQDVAIADFVIAQRKAINWGKITDKMLYGVYFGYAVAEVMWVREGIRTRYPVPIL